MAAPVSNVKEVDVLVVSMEAEFSFSIDVCWLSSGCCLCCCLVMTMECNADDGI